MLTKEFLVSSSGDGIILTTQFSLSASANAGMEATINLLDWAITSSNAESELMSDHELFVKVESKDTFFNKLKKCGFTLKEGRKLRLPLKETPHPESIVLNERPKNCYITLKKTDLSRLAQGKPFKGFETVLSYPFLSVEQTINRTLKTISTKTSSAFSLVDFTSRVEEVNRILCKLPQDFKGVDRLDFIKTRRTIQVNQLYIELYEKYPDCHTGQIVSLDSGDWTIVDGHRLYDLVYKFGTKNSKVVHRYNGNLVFKGFRGDYIFMIDEQILNSDNAEIRIRVKPLNSLFSTTQPH